MEIKYQSYGESSKELRPELQLIGRLDLLNKTKYKKRYEDGEITAGEIAALNHKNGLHYELTIVEGGVLICNVVIVGRFIVVNFYDDNNRVYLAYNFNKSTKHVDKLFLNEVWYYNFTSESTQDESYRIHFVFDEDGNVNYRKYDEVTGKFQDFESSHPADVSGLYESYPEFGKYENLIRLERGFPLDIVAAESTAPDDPAEPGNSESKRLPTNWNK